MHSHHIGTGNLARVVSVLQSRGQVAGRWHLYVPGDICVRQWSVSLMGNKFYLSEGPWAVFLIQSQLLTN